MRRTDSFRAIQRAPRCDDLTWGTGDNACDDGEVLSCPWAAIPDGLPFLFWRLLGTTHLGVQSTYKADQYGNGTRQMYLCCQRTGRSLGNRRRDGRGGGLVWPPGGKTGDGSGAVRPPPLCTDTVYPTYLLGVRVANRNRARVSGWTPRLEEGRKRRLRLADKVDSVRT
ncbi:hypothetical protein LZ31DRAFT_220480 [Colletotrichum somersetense]|nr:hypothetical protein LZ31DRAFT_220480 [Colletotrichum somersetense]